jgi:SAM-dependent methyltransferase
MRDIARTARDTNIACYEGGDEIEQYLRKPYHALRIELAISLLMREWQRMNPGRPAPLVADIGAASGAVSRLLAARGMRPLAIDADHAALRAGGIPAVQLDATAILPFADRSLDCVFAGEIIEHLFDPLAFLAQCRRVLRSPGGVLVLTTPNLAAVQDRAAFLFGRSPRHVDPHHEYLRLHIRPFTKSSLENALGIAGLRPLETVSNYVVWQHRDRWLYSRFLARRFPSLGGSLVAVATPA